MCHRSAQSDNQGTKQLVARSITARTDLFALFQVIERHCDVGAFRVSFFIQAMPDVLKTLAPLDPWAQYLFFKQPEPLLDGATPLKALREGRTADVIRVASLLAAEA